MKTGLEPCQVVIGFGWGIIPGFTLEDYLPIYGDTIERVVWWKNGSDVSDLEGKSVRVRFVLRDADLYSLQFQ